jgi:hypothetical protein
MAVSSVLSRLDVANAGKLLGPGSSHLHPATSYTRANIFHNLASAIVTKIPIVVVNTTASRSVTSNWYSEGHKLEVFIREGMQALTCRYAIVNIVSMFDKLCHIGSISV